jgi:hypothetical protein
VDEEAKRRSMEQGRAHLARADGEQLEAAQGLLHPWTDEFEIAVVRAVANGLRPPASVFHAFLICGWTLATRAETKIGPSRNSA